MSWKSKYNLSLNYADFKIKQSVKNKISMRGLINELSAVKVVDFRTCSKPISATSGFTINREIRRDVTIQLFQRWPTEAIAAFPVFPRPILTSTCRLRWVCWRRCSWSPPEHPALQIWARSKQFRRIGRLQRGQPRGWYRRQSRKYGLVRYFWHVKALFINNMKQFGTYDINLK